MRQTLWHIVGWTALTLGLIGVVLPVMPTVPFLLVAVWAFSRSSPQLRNRILRHRQVGPPIRAYLAHGVIPTRAKLFAVAAMAGGVGIALFLGLPTIVVAIQATICAAVAAYVLTRPAAPGAGRRRQSSRPSGG